MWAVGCVLGELYTRRPLFPGKNAVHTLELIFDAVGYPSDIVLRRLLPGSVNQDMRTHFCVASNKNRINSNHFSRLTTGAPPEFINLLNGLCALDPRRRFNSWSAIEDP